MKKLIKHIEINCHFIREKIQRGLMKIEYVSTHDQPIDALSKSLNRVYYEYLMSKLGFSNIDLCSTKFVEEYRYTECIHWYTCVIYICKCVLINSE